MAASRLNLQRKLPASIFPRKVVDLGCNSRLICLVITCPTCPWTPNRPWPTKVTCRGVRATPQAYLRSPACLPQVIINHDEMRSESSEFGR